MSYYVSVGDIPQEQSERLPENGQALAKARKSGTRIYGTLPGTGRATAQYVTAAGTVMARQGARFMRSLSGFGESRPEAPMSYYVSVGEINQA